MPPAQIEPAAHFTVAQRSTIGETHFPFRQTVPGAHTTTPQSPIWGRHSPFEQ